MIADCGSPANEKSAQLEIRDFDSSHGANSQYLTNTHISSWTDKKANASIKSTRIPEMFTSRVLLFRLGMRLPPLALACWRASERPSQS